MPSLSIHPLSILFCWPPDHPELACSPIITRATSVYSRKWVAIRVWSLSDRIASRCYWSRSRDRAPVYPTHISLLCAPDGVNTLDRFKIFEEKDQLKSGGGVEFFSQLSPSKRGSIDPLQALATVIENSCSCLLCPVHSIHSGVKVLLRDAS